MGVEPKLTVPGFQRIEHFSYPAGIRLAVNFTVDYDAMINRRLQNEPAMELTQGEFGGRTGVWRLLELFQRQGIKATFFTPGRICELYPRSLAEVVAQGHEVANHMWEHRIPEDPELEWDHLRKTTEALQKVSGPKQNCAGQCSCTPPSDTGSGRPTTKSRIPCRDAGDAGLRVGYGTS